MYKELALFILLVLVVFINPNWSTNLYNTILGRLLLVGILTYFAMNNTTLALMVALVMIIGFNNFYTNQMYGIEGFSSEVDQDKDKKDKTDLENIDGPLDYTHLENNIRPKESSSIEANNNDDPDHEVSPTSQESFIGGYSEAEW
jgi:hypothetical protein